MPPEASLTEVSPKIEDARQKPEFPPSPSQHSASSPPRKNTMSSTSTATTSTTVATTLSGDGDAEGPSLSAESSPLRTLAPVPPHGIPVSPEAPPEPPAAARKNSRRRTGPLSAQQREKAALIRKLGACDDCRRRRVACNPNHHNMTWEDAVRKYRVVHHQYLDEYRRPAISPAPVASANSRSAFGQDSSQAMDIDTIAPPQQLGQRQPGSTSLSDPRTRTPLPSGPRAEKGSLGSGGNGGGLGVALPSISNSIGRFADLQSMTSRVFANNSRTPYTSAHVLMLSWKDEVDPSVPDAIRRLAHVFEFSYGYKVEVVTIPSTITTPDGPRSPWKWLARRVSDFADVRDQRDVLKIVYYSGSSFLDSNREMVLACRGSRSTTIRWGGIQQILEEATADTLILMDSAYFPSSSMSRKTGVLELIAASAAEDHVLMLGRNTFTNAVADLLQARASHQRPAPPPLSAVQLHAKLLSDYPKLVQDRFAGKDEILSYPSPLHLQVSSSRALSVLLAPVGGAAAGGRELGSPPWAGSGGSGVGPRDKVVNVTVTLREDTPFSTEQWFDWLRAAPDSALEVRLDGSAGGMR